MGASLGTLTVGVGLDASQYTAALTKMEQDAKRFADSQDKISKGIDRQVQSLQKQASQLDLTTRQIKLQELAAKGASTTQIAAADAALRAIEAASNATRKHASDVDAAAKATHGFSFETNAAKRELLVLGHELSQGNYKRFGGSLLVLGEQTGAASLLFSGFGLAIVGAVGALGGFVTAAIKGAQESKAFNDSLRITSNFAGLTEGAFNDMAKSVAASSGASIGSAREISQALVSTGEFGPRVIGLAAEAAARFSTVTGASADSVVKDFTKMGEGVAKWASEHNKQLNYLTLGQYSYIKTLEEQGKTEQAEIENLKALSDHIGGPMVQNLGYLERSLHAASSAWHTFWDAALNVGRAETVEDRIAKLNAQLQSAHSNPVDLPGATGPGGQPLAAGPNDVDALLDKRATLLREQLRGFEQAQSKAEADRVNKAGIDAKDYLDKLDLEVKGVRAVTKELDIYHQKLAAFRAAGGTRSDAQVATDEAGIRRKFQGSDVTHQAQEYVEALKRQVQGVQDATTYEKVLQEAQTGRLAKATAAQLEQAKGLAIEIDVQKTFDAELKDSNASAEVWLKKQLDMAAASKRFVDSLSEQNDALSDEIAVINGGEDARRRQELARIDDAIATREMSKALGELGGATQLELTNLDAEIAKLKERQDLIGQRNSATALAARPADIMTKLSQDEERASIARERGSTTELGELAEIGVARRLAAADMHQYIKTLEDNGNAYTAEAEKARLALAKLDATADPIAKKFNQLFEDSFADSFTDFITGAKSASDAFKSFTASVLQEISRIVARNLAQQIFGGSSPSSGGGFGSAIGAFISGLFGGTKAIGGPTMPNTLYQVAERGPEVFNDGSRSYLLTSNQRGNIDPQPMRGGNRTTNIVTNVTVPGATNRRTAAQIAAEVALRLAAANARNN